MLSLAPCNFFKTPLPAQPYILPDKHPLGHGRTGRYPLTTASLRPLLKRVWVICILLIPLHLFATGSSPFTSLSCITVDYLNLSTFYDHLSEAEKEEQIADWATWSLLTYLQPKLNQFIDYFADQSPLRFTYTKKMFNTEFLPGRIVPVKPDEWVLLVATINYTNPYVHSYLLDYARKLYNKIPTFVHLYVYENIVSSATIKITRINSIPGKTFFTPEYGYYTQIITNPTDFIDCLNQIDDVTYLDWDNKNLVFGGRKYEPQPTSRGLNIEEVATIYQIYNDFYQRRKTALTLPEYKKMISIKYLELLKKDGKLRTRIQTGKISPEKILSSLSRETPYHPPEEDVNLGFSLDPHLNYNNFTRDINELANLNYRLIPREDLPLREQILTLTPTLNQIATELRDKKINQLLSLRRKLKATNASREEKILAEILNHIQQDNTYQTARYDGNLYGTRIGMILFYTDLAAKLWALNYHNLAPRTKVTGFRTMADIPVAKMYWDEFLKLSNTRLWFGLRQENYEIYDRSLLFAPICTRVYAASSDPLFPGKESEPNQQSAEFLGWWDDHYANVAQYETYYYQLNQIQKWALIFLILQEEKKFTLDFLTKIPVSRTTDFVSWYKTTPGLKNRTELPFLNRNLYQSNTEVISLLNSTEYPLMNQYFFLSGGVSLAKRKEILSKLTRPISSPKLKYNTKTSSPESEIKRRSVYQKINLIEKPNTPKSVQTKTDNIKGISKDIPPPKYIFKTWQMKVPPTKRLRGPEIELYVQKIETELQYPNLTTDTVRTVSLNYQFDDLPYGTFKITVDNQLLTLTWTKDVFDSLITISQNLVTKNQDIGEIDGFLKNIPLEKIKSSDGLLHLNYMSPNKKSVPIYLTLTETEIPIKSAKKMFRTAKPDPNLPIITTWQLP